MAALVLVLAIRRDVSTASGLQAVAKTTYGASAFAITWFAAGRLVEVVNLTWLGLYVLAFAIVGVVDALAAMIDARGKLSRPAVATGLLAVFYIVATCIHLFFTEVGGR